MDRLGRKPPTRVRFGSFRKTDALTKRYYFVAEQQIWLMTLYDKDEAADLTPKEKKALKSAVEAERQARRASRLAREKRLRRIR